MSQVSLLCKTVMCIAECLGSSLASATSTTYSSCNNQNYLQIVHMPPAPHFPAPHCAISVETTYLVQAPLLNKEIESQGSHMTC